MQKKLIGIFLKTPEFAHVMKAFADTVLHDLMMFKIPANNLSLSRTNSKTYATETLVHLYLGLLTNDVLLSSHLG
jgi:hypothetical protein